MGLLKDDLEKVAASLELGWSQRGWRRGLEIDQDAQRNFGDSNGYRHGCIYMHINAVSRDGEEGEGEFVEFASECRERADAMIQALGFDPLESDEMFFWNDLDTTTWDDVKARVREAIEKL